MPLPEMLEDLDVMIFDMQDVGSRYYTFIYTMAHVMMACRRDGKRMVVLDRPNPISGNLLEGNVLRQRYASFVGMYPILIRHGMTVAELALMFNTEFGIECDLEVVPMQGWKREMWYDETGLPWVIPSPNMPTLETAAVYPGMCMIEGTNLSEGRGTTRPFEIFGAPFVEPEKLCRELENFHLPGVIFRDMKFRPTFQKWKGMVCGGAQIHVTNRQIFKPVLTTAAILLAFRRLYPSHFSWRLPPYEYEYEKLPFDILAGTSQLRRMIDENWDLDKMTATWADDEEAFRTLRQKISPLSLTMSIESVLEELRKISPKRRWITCWQHLPSKAAQYADFPPDISPRLIQALNRKGIPQLYSHQARVYEATAAGNHPVIVTPTASGKNALL